MPTTFRNEFSGLWLEQRRIFELEPGKYKVSVFADSEIAAKQIPAEYKDPLTTTIEVEVDFGKKNEFQFELGK